MQNRTVFKVEALQSVLQMAKTLGFLSYIYMTYEPCAGSLDKATTAAMNAKKLCSSADTAASFDYSELTDL
eukprot:SAG11_NODE_31956_length_287_cov_1.382979_1_plen_71_part_01